MAAGATKKIMITGANGFVARQAIKALQDSKDPIYELHLVDKTFGEDSHNRFAIERVEQALFSPMSNKRFKLLDLTNKEAFAQVLTEIEPDCVFHFAGALENQDPKTIRDVNFAINNNVLTLCAECAIPVVPMSSIMVMYGLAVEDPEIAAAFRGEAVTIPKNDLLTTAMPLNNGPRQIRQFNPDEKVWPGNLAYIQSKEALEALAKGLCTQYPCATIIPVRLGWTGMRNPYQLESPAAPYTEATVYLDSLDLHSFILSITREIMAENLHGYHCYFAVSEHPQRWVSLYQEAAEIGWAPKVNTETKYKPGAATCPFRQAKKAAGLPTTISRRPGL